MPPPDRPRPVQLGQELGQRGQVLVALQDDPPHRGSRITASSSTRQTSGGVGWPWLSTSVPSCQCPPAKWSCTTRSHGHRSRVPTGSSPWLTALVWRFVTSHSRPQPVRSSTAVTNSASSISPPGTTTVAVMFSRISGVADPPPHPLDVRGDHIHRLRRPGQRGQMPDRHAPGPRVRDVLAPPRRVEPRDQLGHRVEVVLVDPLGAPQRQVQPVRDDREVVGEEIQLGTLLLGGVEVVVGRDLQEIDAPRGGGTGRSGRGRESRARPPAPAGGDSWLSHLRSRHIRRLRSRRLLLHSRRPRRLRSRRPRLRLRSRRSHLRTRRSRSLFLGPS